jgi:hypothetical protein
VIYDSSGGDVAWSPGPARAALWAWAKTEGIWSLVLPLFLFYGMREWQGPGTALVLASLAPLGALVVGAARERRVKPVALLVGASALLGALVAWTFRDPRAIVYKDAVVDALWGVAFATLALLPAARRLHGLATPAAPLLRRGATARDWDRPAVQATVRRLLLLWSAQSLLFSASKPLCLLYFGLDDYLLATVTVRVTVQTLVTLFSLWRLRRALGPA